MRSRQNITSVEARVSNLETKFEAFMRSHEDFKIEMRQQNEMRATEIRELRQDMKTMQKDFYTKMDNMDTKIDNIGNHVRNLSVATIIGVATIAITVIYSILTR